MHIKQQELSKTGSPGSATFFTLQFTRDINEGMKGLLQKKGTKNKMTGIDRPG